MKNHIVLLFVCLFVSTHLVASEVSTKPIVGASPLEVTSMPPISIYDLPVVARQMITSHFGAQNVVACQLTHCGRRYLVRLTDKRSVFFDEVGNWLYIDCRPQYVPELLIPSKLRNQIAEKYGPYEHVVKMVRKKNEIKVILTNEVKMSFNL